MSRLSSPLKRTQRFHKLEYASTLRGHGNIPRRLFRQGLSVHIVADAWTELMSRVIRAAKRDGHSGGSRSVRDHDVDIIMEALCFCSLPKRLWPHYPYSIYSGSCPYIQLINIHAFAPNSYPQFLRLFKRHLPRRTPTSQTSSPTYRKTGSP
jgi:hypothetical protein